MRFIALAPWIVLIGGTVVLSLILAAARNSGDDQPEPKAPEPTPNAA